jgi:DNA-binding CsgD family transcriptional regulator/tetratricopeptide (TPR) repeat protein
MPMSGVPPQPASRAETRLHGREREQDRIGLLLAEAAAGRGGALILRGAPGAGRTSLLRWAAAQAVTAATRRADAGMPGDGDPPPGAGCTVLIARGHESETDLPYAALQQLLSPLIEDGATAAGLHPAQARVALDAITVGRCPDEHRYLLRTATLALLRRAALHRPVLCCLDDLPAFDPQSRQVLTFAAHRLADAPIAMLLVGDALAGLADLQVGPVDGRAAAAIIDDRLSARYSQDPPAQEAAGELTRALTTLAEGNPLALVELADGLTEEQRWGEAEPPVALPPDSALRLRHRRQLAPLPAATRWLLLLAAADRTVDIGPLIRAAELSSTATVALAAAEQAHLVRVSGQKLIFVQPLLAATVYQEATLAQRRAAHQVLAAVLEHDPLRGGLHRAVLATGADRDLAAGLALAADAETTDRGNASRAMEWAATLTARSAQPDQVELAGSRLVRAARYAWLAGEPHRARLLLRRLGPGSGVTVLAQAQLLRGEIELRAGGTVRARQTIADATSTLGDATTADRTLLLSALAQAGEAARLSGDYPHYAGIAQQAQALRQAAHRPALAAAPQTPDEAPVPPAEALESMRFETFAGLAAMFNADFANASPTLRRVLDLAPDLDDAAALTQASLAAIVLGDEPAAYQLAQRAVAVAQRSGDLAIAPQALEHAGTAQFAMGRYAQAREIFLAGVRLSHATGQQSLACQHLSMLALMAATLGDAESCLRWIRQARTHPASCDVSRSRAVTDWALGVLDLVAGRPREALIRLAGLASMGAGTGQLAIQLAATPHLVEAATWAGEPQAAAEPAAIYDAWAANTRSPGWLALAIRCRALLADAPDAAEQHYRQALVQHAMGPSDFERARTQLLFGKELRRARQPAAARAQLNAALATFRAFDALPYVEQAGTELRAAGERAAGQLTGVAEALTPQQLKIASLAAGGATNREVAAQLVLSSRTVDHHMRNIFARLGIRSRVELTKLLR